MYGLLKTETRHNVGTAIGPFCAPNKVIRKIIYGFEAYPDDGYVERNMLSQQAGVNTYFDEEFDDNVMTAVVQTLVAGFPSRSYRFNGSVTGGVIDNFVPWNYAGPVNDRRWQFMGQNTELNRFGQTTVVSSGRSWIRNVYGYNSSRPKATFQYEWPADATYTGFEDIRFADGSPADDDEQWSDADLVRSHVTAVTARTGSNSYAIASNLGRSPQ